MASIEGAIFPISSKHANRIFYEGRIVFAKYTKFKNLRKNSKIIFYISKEKYLFGEGTIETIAKLDPKTAWALFGNKMFLNIDEFEQYTLKSPIGGKSRAMPEISVYLLKNLRVYSKNAQSSMPITPAGRYATKEEYDKCIKYFV
jgi:hypothetical protein